MRKEFNMMIIIVVCAILGIICAAIINILYTQGILIDSLLIDDMTISDLDFVVFFAWLVVGIIAGVLKN